MTHAKRLSINQYKPHLITVFRLAYTSYIKWLGKSVSLSLYLLCMYRKKNENRIFDLSYLRNPLTQELKKNLWAHVHLKMYQKFFEVSMIFETWLTRGLKMAILAILFISYITIAGKSDFLKFLVLLICHFYHVDMLFRMLLVGPAPFGD